MTARDGSFMSLRPGKSPENRSGSPVVGSLHTSFYFRRGATFCVSYQLNYIIPPRFRFAFAPCGKMDGQLSTRLTHGAIKSHLLEGN